jgi:molybdopterin biosynthesis enzyme
MKLIKTENAVGAILCHDLTRILPGVLKDAAFRKGHVVKEEDISVLLSMGKENLYVWEEREGLVHENDAAAFLYKLCAGKNMSPSSVKEGKIDIIAQRDGLLLVDATRLLTVNCLGEIIIASRRSNMPARKGDKLAGMRVIPLAIEQSKLETARVVIGVKPIFELRPFLVRSYAIVVTGGEVLKGIIEDAFAPALRKKMAEYNCIEVGCAFPGDDPEYITNAALGFLEGGAEIVLCAGGMSVDPDDKTPAAIKNTGARIVSYGAPVLPGSMFMLAYWNEKSVIMGLPGCIMHDGVTIFDAVLPRVLADVKLTVRDIAEMGYGGYCCRREYCVFPNCGFAAGM